MQIEFTKLLKDNKEFQSSDNITIEYRMDAPEYKQLEEKYHLSSIAGKGEKDIKKALNLLAWVNAHIRHTGNYDNSDWQDALTLLDVSYDKDYGINCLAMSIVLCECLLAVGVKARVMYMMPQSAEDGDNHVVVEAFISELHKWIMLDPTYGSYCVDSDGVILNLFEMRNSIACDREFFLSDTINYNGEKVDDLDDVKNYYAKNLFFFRVKSVQGFGEHREYGNMLEFSPSGFDVHKRMVDNLSYRIDTYGDFEMFRIWKKYEESLENQYIDINALY